jgi:hypothetical protein
MAEADTGLPRGTCLTTGDDPCSRSACRVVPFDFSRMDPAVVAHSSLVAPPPLPAHHYGLLPNRDACSRPAAARRDPTTLPHGAAPRRAGSIRGRQKGRRGWGKNGGKAAKLGAIAHSSVLVAFSLHDGRDATASCSRARRRCSFAPGSGWSLMTLVDLDCRTQETIPNPRTGRAPSQSQQTKQPTQTPLFHDHDARRLIRSASSLLRLLSPRGFGFKSFTLRSCIMAMVVVRGGEDYSDLLSNSGHCRPPPSSRRWRQGGAVAVNVLCSLRRTTEICELRDEAPW